MAIIPRDIIGKRHIGDYCGYCNEIHPKPPKGEGNYHWRKGSHQCKKLVAYQHQLLRKEKEQVNGPFRHKGYYRKKVEQYTKKGFLVKVWPSVTSVAKSLNINRATFANYLKHCPKNTKYKEIAKYDWKVIKSNL